MGQQLATERLGIGSAPASSTSTTVGRSDRPRAPRERAVRPGGWRYEQGRDRAGRGTRFIEHWRRRGGPVGRPHRQGDAAAGGRRATGVPPPPAQAGLVGPCFLIGVRVDADDAPGREYASWHVRSSNRRSCLGSDLHRDPAEKCPGDVALRTGPCRTSGEIDGGGACYRD